MLMVKIEKFLSSNFSKNTVLGLAIFSLGLAFSFPMLFVELLLYVSLMSLFLTTIQVLAKTILKTSVTL